MPVPTTHVGSLPRTAALLEANAHRTQVSEEEFSRIMQDAVDEVVRRQHSIGLSIVNDGEYGHAMSTGVDYGAWWTYSFSRFSGLELVDDPSGNEVVPASGSPVTLGPFSQRRDWVRFRDAYQDPESGIQLGNGAKTGFPTMTGPLSYVGQSEVARDIEGLSKALAAVGLTPADGFIAAVAPGSAARIGNAYYADDSAALDAWADALHEEYKAITDAGFTLQLDDPGLAEAWDQVNPQPPLGDYRDYVAQRVAAINRALRGIPADQVRLHVCWGSWHGPHTTDLPLKDFVDIVLGANVHGLSFEAGNVRHEHEWTIWKEGMLPDDKVLIPGVVSHSTNVVEHPELVAQRIRNFTDAVGKDRVIASTDCGLGGRIHPSIAWAKLETMVEGAQLVK